jgi:hypothetical protein
MLVRQKSDVWLRGANIETGGGREGGKMYQEMVYYNRMHVKTRLSQSILSKIVDCSEQFATDANKLQVGNSQKICKQSL